MVVLSPEQLEEFDTPMLQNFAKAYLEFQHSSPCTSKRKLFKYFEPLSTEELEENEILFGADREKTYQTLLAEFKVCIVAKEFDKFFQQKNKTLYWQSKTLPKLVILKKWLSE